jgi:site-specific recombinase XerD
MNSAISNLLEIACKGKKSTDLVFTNKPQSSRKVVFRDGNNKEELLDLPIINTQHFSNTRFKSLQKQVNIPKEHFIGAHGLRHTFASHYVMNGGDLYILSKILGHSSIKITEVYAHLSPKHKLDLESFVNFSF